MVTNTGLPKSDAFHIFRIRIVRTSCTGLNSYRLLRVFSYPSYFSLFFSRLENSSCINGVENIIHFYGL